MNNKPVTSLEDLPKCRLSVKTVLAPGRYPGDLEIQTAKDNMRRSLAAKMLEQEKLFSVSLSQDGFMTVRADIVVMTAEQFGDLMIAQFKKGVDHGLYYSTPSPMAWGSK